MRNRRMRLLVSGCTTTLRREYAARPDRLGVLLTPANGNGWWWGGVPWAADNGCFGGFDEGRWVRFLARLATAPTPPLWVTCPDVVGDAAATLGSWREWRPRLGDLPAALVGQDGLQVGAVPWDDLTCLFVGGSTAWKLSDAAAELVREAKRLGKLVHAGRVNTARRIRYFARLGADSFDGSGFSAWGDKRIPLAVRWVDRALGCKQSVMFGGNA
jgi:hypothetical protein